MSYQFSINLARSEVGELRLSSARSRVMAVCFFIFGAMLVATFLVYLHRHSAVERRREQLKTYAGDSQDDQVSLERIASAKKRARQFEAKLEILQGIVDSSASWSSILAWVMKCCRKHGLEVREVEGKTIEDRPFVVVQGVCGTVDSVSRTHKLKGTIAEHKLLGLGRVRSLEKVPGNDRVRFNVEVPLVLSRPVARVVKVKKGAGP